MTTQTELFQLFISKQEGTEGYIFTDYYKDWYGCLYINCMDVKQTRKTFYTSWQHLFSLLPE